MRSEFTRADANGNGKIDAADIEMHTAMTAAGIRQMMAMQIMGADLNGDGVVTADELRRKFRYDRRNFTNQNRAVAPSVDEQVEQHLQQLMKADLDKDGKITWSEAIEYAKAQPGYARSVEAGFASSARQILELAPGKPAITLAEIRPRQVSFSAASIPTITAPYRSTNSTSCASVSRASPSMMRSCACSRIPAWSATCRRPRRARR